MAGRASVDCRNCGRSHLALAAQAAALSYIEIAGPQLANPPTPRQLRLPALFGRERIGCLTSIETQPYASLI
jgi:hypothetical protein